MIRSSTEFVDEWRRRKSAAFELYENSTAGRTVEFELWGRPVSVYANANLSIYSAQACNAACPFCVEELRPSSRGVELHWQKRREANDEIYFDRLKQVLEALQPLQPSISITGGEPSKDARLTRILQSLSPYPERKRTLTTNGTGLLDARHGRRIIDWIADSRLDHLNISVAHPVPERNARLMRLPGVVPIRRLREIVEVATAAGVRVRLSCVLIQPGISSLTGIFNYLEFARSIGVDNVIFRQLMKTDPATHVMNSVVRYSDRHRVCLEPLLDEISATTGFAHVTQIIGYYYYVEVWNYEGMDVVFEEADLRHLEAVKRLNPDTIHELVFHPNGQLTSTWQPWDGVLGPDQSQRI